MLLLCLQLVIVLLVTWNLWFETSTLSLLLDNGTWLRGWVGWVTAQHAPVVKDQLWESLTTSGLSQLTGETERLVNWQVGLDGEQWGTWSLLLRDNLTSLLVQNRVDTTNGVLWTLDLDQENWFLDSWLSQQHGSVGNSSHSWDDLTTTSVDSISVQGNIQDVNSDRSDVLTKDRTFLGSPLESSDNRVLDFVQVLNGLSLVNNQVRTVTVWTETPDLSGVSDIPAVLVSQDSGSSLEIISWVDDTLLNVLRNLLVNWFSLDVDSVVLVRRLRQSNHGRLGLDSLSVRDDWWGDLQWDTSVVVLQVTQANLQVQLTGSSNNVLTRLVDGGHDTWVRLGQSLQTFDQLRQVVGVLDLNSDLDNWGDRELHDLQVVSGLGGGDGTRLQQELVNTDQTDNVTGWTVVDLLDLTTHHQDGSLDRLQEQVILLTDLVVWTLDSDLHTSLDGTSENTTESVESTLIGGWNHLGNVQHQVTLRVTVSDGLAVLIVRWTFVQGLSSVSLSSDWRWQVNDNHLQHGISSRQELSHDNLQQSLTLQLLLVVLQVDLQLLQQGWDLSLLEVHDSREQSEDRVQNEHVESSLQWLAISVNILVGPLLGLRVEVRVTPQSFHHLASVDTKLLGVSDSELSDGESPTVQTGTESNGTLLWEDLLVTERLLLVGRDDDVNGLNSSGERLVQVLLGSLQLQEGSVNLVDNDNWLDSLTQSLSQHGFGLDTDTFNTVDDNQSTVSNSQSGGDLRREVNVTWGVNQVNQELSAVGLLLDLLDGFLIEGSEQRNSSRLNGNTSLLLILSGIHKSGVTSLSGGDNTSLLDQRIGQGGLTVIDVGNDGDVTDVSNRVHQTTDLVNSESNCLLV